MPTRDKFFIFYSWQSDLPRSTHNGPITEGLQGAAKNLQRVGTDDPLAIIIDTATRDMPGAPNIPIAILTKIEMADMFVADVSIVASLSDKHCPNPNVVFELGYAVQVLGWSRIVLLMNLDGGHSPKELPFDFDRQRISPFRVKSGSDADGKRSLQDLLIVAIGSILEKQPPRISPVAQISVEDLWRNRDVITIRSLLQLMPLSTIDSHLAESPMQLDGHMIILLEWWDQLVGSSSFYIHDQTLLDLIEQFDTQFRIGLSYPDQYMPGPEHMLFFRNYNSIPLSSEQRLIFNSICEANQSSQALLSQILTHLRKNYPEIDIEQLSTEAERALYAPSPLSEEFEALSSLLKDEDE